LTGNIHGPNHNGNVVILGNGLSTYPGNNKISTNSNQRRFQISLQLPHVGQIRLSGRQMRMRKSWVLLRQKPWIWHDLTDWGQLNWH